MKNDKKNKEQKSFLSSAIQGSVVGGGVTAVVSPLLGWTNLVIQAKKNQASQSTHYAKLPKINIMRLLFNKQVFSGTSTYVTSVAPVTALALASNNAMANSLPKTKTNTLISAFAGGFIAGVISTPFEAIAQSATLTQNMSKKNIVNNIRQHNSTLALMRGASMLGLREGLWFPAYTAASTMLGPFFESQGLSKDNSETFATFVAGAAFGLISCPINLFRFAKQSDLTKPCENKSYPQHFNILWQRAPKASTSQRIGFFFTGGLPRTLTAASAATLMHLGTKAYKAYCPRP